MTIRLVPSTPGPGSDHNRQTVSVLNGPDLAGKVVISVDKSGPRDTVVITVVREDEAYFGPVRVEAP